jgi:hypothetical protein
MRQRPGNTEKITISLGKDELSAMKRRAKRLHEGNLSAAFSEFARLAVKEEALDRLLAQLPPSSPEAIARIEQELAAPLPPPPKRRRRRKAR